MTIGGSVTSISNALSQQVGRVLISVDSAINALERGTNGNHNEDARNVRIDNVITNFEELRRVRDAFMVNKNPQEANAQYPFLRKINQVLDLHNLITDGVAPLRQPMTVEGRYEMALPQLEYLKGFLIDIGPIAGGYRRRHRKHHRRTHRKRSHRKRTHRK